MHSLIQGKWKKVWAYVLILGFSALLMALFPVSDAMWDPVLIISISALLFTLLVYLSAKLVKMDGDVWSILLVATFLLLFMPGSSSFFMRDELSVMELGSQCIVPFFLQQYDRVSQKPYSGWHFLMLLMGIFCSYTHDGITIPLCTGFLWMAFIHRGTFFRTACWPMVTGFVIGTVLSIWNAMHEGSVESAYGLESYTSRTALALSVLWDTKIFLITVGLTAYLSVSRWGRQILIENFRGYTLLSCCAMFSYCVLPFAPLGVDNAVTGVCFFCMYWAMLLMRSLLDKFVVQRKSQIIKNKI